VRFSNEKLEENFATTTTVAKIDNTNAILLQVMLHLQLKSNYILYLCCCQNLSPPFWKWDYHVINR